MSVNIPVLPEALDKALRETTKAFHPEDDPEGKAADALISILQRVLHVARIEYQDMVNVHKPLQTFLQRFHDLPATARNALHTALRETVQTRNPPRFDDLIRSAYDQLNQPSKGGPRPTAHLRDMAIQYLATFYELHHFDTTTPDNLVSFVEEVFDAIREHGPRDVTLVFPEQLNERVLRDTIKEALDPTKQPRLIGKAEQEFRRRSLDFEPLVEEPACDTEALANEVLRDLATQQNFE